VVKGPSGTLYGSSLISYGGLINVVTKKPFDYFGGNVSYTLGSFGLNRVTADVNTPLDETGKVALRVNTAYHKQNSFQDMGFRESFFFAPSLSYLVNDRLSFLVNTEIYRGESTNPTMLFVDRGAPLRATNIEELGYDPKRSYTSNDLTIVNPNFSLQGQMNYKLSRSGCLKLYFQEVLPKPLAIIPTSMKPRVFTREGKRFREPLPTLMKALCSQDI
jgi:iron complex outermembrane recepter protein